MNKQKVYRAGSMTPSPDAGAAHSVTAAADGVRLGTALPPRLGSLFAAPTLPGVIRWVRGNHGCRYETRVREITVDADTTYVFRVSAWEDVSWNLRGFEADKARAYWNTGTTLTDWLTRAADEGLDGSEWEVIIPTTAVLGVRNVSTARLLAAVTDDYTRREIQRITRGWARADCRARPA